MYNTFFAGGGVMSVISVLLVPETRCALVPHSEGKNCLLSERNKLMEGRGYFVLYMKESTKHYQIHYFSLLLFLKQVVRYFCTIYIYIYFASIVIIVINP